MIAPSLIPKRPGVQRRTTSGGYLIDFWGAGCDVADPMGIVPEMMRRGYRLAAVREVGDDGHRITAFDPELFVRGTDERYVSIARSELAATIYGALGGRVETILGDTVRALDDDGDRDRVTFGTGTRRDFDLVTGADDLHSPVRRSCREVVGGRLGEQLDLDRDLHVAHGANADSAGGEREETIDGIGRPRLGQVVRNGFALQTDPTRRSGASAQPLQLEADFRNGLHGRDQSPA